MIAFLFSLKVFVFWLSMLTQHLLDVFETFLVKIDDHYKLDRAKQLQACLVIYKNPVTPDLCPDVDLRLNPHRGIFMP